MRPTLFLLTLLLASLAAHAQQTTTTVRDRLWIFTVIGGGNNKKSPDSPGGNTTHYIDDFAPGGSRMTPAEGAFWLGVPNLLFIRSNNLPALPTDETGRKKSSYQQYAASFQPLERVVWSVIGGGGMGGGGSGGGMKSRMDPISKLQLEQQFARPRSAPPDQDRTGT
jgi:hypothetical protein